MKKLLFVILIAAAQCGYAGIKTTDSFEHNLYSQIESLDDARAYITQFPEGEFKNQLLERTFPLVSKISYHYTKSKRYQLRRQDFIYNDKGNLLAQRDSLGFGETYTYHLEYNSDNQLVKKTTINNTSLQSVVTFEYAESGKKIKEIDEYTHGGVSERYFEYDAGGRIVSNYIKKKNERIESYTYSYDINGNKQASKNISRTDVSGSFEDQYEYTYDSENNLTNETFSGKYLLTGTLINESKGTRKFLYDANNNLIKENYEYESTPVDIKGLPYYLASTTIYIRDVNGLLLEERHLKTTKNGTDKQLEKTLKYYYTYIQLKDIL